MQMLLWIKMKIARETFEYATDTCIAFYFCSTLSMSMFIHVKLCEKVMICLVFLTFILMYRLTMNFNILQLILSLLVLGVISSFSKGREGAIINSQVCCFHSFQMHNDNLISFHHLAQFLGNMGVLIEALTIRAHHCSL